MGRPIIIKIDADTHAGQAKVEAFTRALEDQMAKAGASSNQASDGMKQLNADMTKVTDTAEKYMKRAFIAVTAVVVASAAAIVNWGSDFEYATQRVANICGATAEEIKVLEDRARELGAATQYTATQVMEGMQSLASLALGVENVSSAIDDALQLAGMFGSEVAVASQGIAVAMNNLGINVSRSQEVVDKFAVAIQNSLFPNLETFVDGFTEASMAAGAFKYSIEEVLNGLRLFASTGLRAQRAGMAYKMTLNNLAEASDGMNEALERVGLTYEQIDPQLHSMTEIFQTLADSAFGVSEATKVFGQRIGLAVASIIQQFREGRAGVEAFTEKLNDSAGTVEKAYGNMMITLKGWWDQLKSAVQEAALTIYDASKGEMKMALERLTVMVRDFGKKLLAMNLAEKARDLYNTLDTLAKAAGFLATRVIPQLIGSLVALKAYLAAVSGKALSCSTAIAGIATVAAIVAVQIIKLQNQISATLSEAAAANFESAQKSQKAIDTINQMVTAQKGWTPALIASIKASKDALAEIVDNVDELITKITTGKLAVTEFGAMLEEELTDTEYTFKINAQLGEFSILTIADEVANAGARGIKRWSNEINEVAKGLSESWAEAILESAYSGDYQTYLRTINEQISGAVNAGLVEAFRKAIMEQQVIQPLLDAIKNIKIDWELGIIDEESLYAVQAAREQVIAKMEILWPVVEQLTATLAEMDPTVRQVTDELEDSLYGLDGPLDNLALKLGQPVPGLEQLAGAAGAAANSLNRIGGESLRLGETKAATTVGLDYRGTSLIMGEAWARSVRQLLQGLGDYGFQGGSSYVPRTGLAMVHEGEKVVRKEEAVRGGSTVVLNFNITALDQLGMRKVIQDQIMPEIRLATSRGW